MLGILAFGFLSDNVLRLRMYITISVVTLAQMGYLIIMFVCDQSIAEGSMQV